jgi:diguanylate cyclase (GGDEF)-like protein
MEKAKDNIKEIIRICLELDIAARDVYQNFSSLPLSSELKNSIKILFDDENRHIAYWEGLLKLFQEGTMLDLLEDSEKLLQELTIMAKTAHKIFKNSLHLAVADTSNLLLQIIKMEFVFLHPSFIVLFKFAGLLPQHLSMEDEYEEHINHICSTLKADSTGNPVFSMFSDLFYRTWRDTKRLLYLNQYDELSGVLNRRGFYEQIRPLSYLALRKNYYVAIMMIDIDHFKQINDKYGHKAGDRALCLVAEFVIANVRKSDIVARYGGDEFIIFFNDVDKESLIGMVEKIKAGIEARSKGSLPLTISIGISLKVMGGEPTITIENLIKSADAALYEVKQAGRNSFCIRMLD